MLNEIITKRRYSFHEKFDSWEDAVRAACVPLEEEGVIEKEYSSYIINNVHEFGPYIVIAPDICIPHAQEGRGVNETAIAFMHVKEPVDFGEEADYTARLFFVLASTDNEKHLENLSELVSLLENEEIVEKFVAAKSFEDLQELI
ncbi:PTS system IIA component, L-Asc family [Granulicatella balaenopterae]|uniref:Ascorbate-specific PTS system EIIA component n=1 Tax=Granulicatella balaenopterae TaxID=137733 RepID=A0A1H9MVY3_9LACT|nr:PTS sugar transporter subunit IIA [Granulicatella balaenopterae]SER27731.1 PTS system IIA component, L-Asc family [Granulicatella balaenopterae]